jgi:NAD(P)-dependent dehydrogenase (short-subunit alcohol dehydrogenase family)
MKMMRPWRKDDRRPLLGVAGVAAVLAGRELLAKLREADLRDRVALVTGGSRGLGLLIARELAGEGCRLVICARDEQELERAREDLERRGAAALAVPCDVGDRNQVTRMVDEAIRRFGRIDILVNNAGTIQVGPARSMTIEDYEEAMRVMFWGLVYPTLAVIPSMVGRGDGRIVNVTSIGGKVSVPHLLPYASAKSAAVGFSEGLRAELARDGITVTTIAPGLMRTGSPLNAFFKGDTEREYGLFSTIGSLPFISMDAERAARQIVRAAKRGEAERVLSIPATLLARFHGLFPGLTADLLGLANRVLPGANGAVDRKQRGMELHEQVRSDLLDNVTGWNLDAAERFNQHPGPVQTR